jgi:exoribonuclease R
LASSLFPYDKFQHFGVETPIYNHFSFSIGLYADLIVYSQLVDLLWKSFTSDL